MLESQSENPPSNLDTDALEEWIENRFPHGSIPDDVECVPSSNLLNPSSSFIIPLNSPSSAPSSADVAYTEDQILAQCQSIFLRVMGYHYDRHSFGGVGSQVFISRKSFTRAYMDAKQRSVEFCKTFCEHKGYDNSIIERLIARLVKFAEDAIGKIGKKNTTNCLRYLERNKKNELEKFVDMLESRYRFLHYPYTITSTCVINYYNSKQMDEDISSCISKSMMEWNSLKASVLEKCQGQEEDINQIEYNDDVESSLNHYKAQLLLENEKHVETYLLDSLDREYSSCKKKIDDVINEANYLDQITKDDFCTHVQDFKRSFGQEICALIQNIDSNKRNDIKAHFESELEEKGEKLMEYGEHLLQTEIEKAHDSLHADVQNDLVNILTQLQDKYRLKMVRSIYEPHVRKAMTSAKMQLKQNSQETTVGNDLNEENSGVGPSTSSGLSTFNLNMAARKSRDRNGQLAKENFPNVSVKEDCDSGDTVILSPRPKKFRKHRVPAEMNETTIQ